MKKCLATKSPKKIQKIGRKGTTLYKCKFCPKIYKFSQSLYRHQEHDCNAARIKAGKQPLPPKTPKQKEFVCETCFKKFDRAHKLEQHKKIHTGENIKVCNRCDRGFKRIDFYTEHIKTCDGTKEPEKRREPEGEKLQCATCGKSFNKKRVNIYDIHVATCEGSELTEDQSTEETYLGGIPSFVQPKPRWEERQITDEENIGADMENLEDLGVHMLEETIDCDKSEENCDLLRNDDDPICIVIPNDYPDQSFGLSNTDDFMQDSFTDIGDSFTEGESICENNDSEEQYKELRCDGFLKDLSKNKRKSGQLFSELYMIFGVRLPQDEKLQNWLAKSIGMRIKRFKDRLLKWLKPGLESARGRPSLTPLTTQTIFDAWLAHSTISVDRRDGHDMVRIPMSAYKERYPNIETSLVKPHTNKRNTIMAEAPRYMCHKTVREMVRVIEENMVNFPMDLSLIFGHFLLLHLRKGRN